MKYTNMGHAIAQSRKLRVIGGASLLQFAGLTLLAGSLLPVGVCARAQEPTKHQEKLYDDVSGFLGDSYSKLQPDPGDGDWLTYLKTRDVLKNSDTFLLEPVKFTSFLRLNSVALSLSSWTSCRSTSRKLSRTNSGPDTTNS